MYFTAKFPKTFIVARFSKNYWAGASEDAAAFFSRTLMSTFEWMNKKS